MMRMEFKNPGLGIELGLGIERVYVVKLFRDLGSIK